MGPLSSYKIIWSQAAASQRDSIDRSVRRRIVAKLEQAATDPERYSIRLVNSPFHRIRVGDWRVIIHIDRGAIQVIVIEVKHRRNAY